MNSKGVKIHYRLRYVSEDKINKLYQRISYPCIQCMHDCKNCVGDTEDCVNREQREDLNEIVEMIKSEKVNLIRFVDDYNLKLDILLDMLRGNKILSYKYYKCICHRLHLKGYDEYEKYKIRFAINEEENNEIQPESEVDD